MDGPQNASSIADESCLAPDEKGSAFPTGNEALPCLDRDRSGEGDSVWATRVTKWPLQMLDSSQHATASAHASQGSPFDGTASSFNTGYGFHIPSASEDNPTLELRSLVTGLRGESAWGLSPRSVTKMSSEVVKMLEGHPDIDANELFDGFGILHAACLHNQLELLGVILKRPDINVNLTTQDGLTGLHIACHECNVDVMTTLLQSPHINVNIRDESHLRTPLHLAVIQGSQALTARLLEVDEIEVQAKDAFGYLPVHYAGERPMLPLSSWYSGDTQNYKEESLQHICSNGAINLKTPQGKAPIHLASEAVNIAALTLFLAQPDLDANMTDSQGNTALHLAKNINVLDLLLEKGLDANIQNLDGNTALHCALERQQGEERLAQLLLRNTKLDGQLRNHKGEQFLHLAAAKWDLEMFKRLAPKPLGRDVNVPTDNGETMLHIAARVGNIDVVKYLVNVPRTNLNAQDNSLRTPLHLACEQGHVDVVKHLISAPLRLIYVNPRDERRQTPLHFACQKEHLEVVRILLSIETTIPDVADAHGWTPLHFASESASGEPIVCELLRARMDVNRQIPNNDATALHLASRRGNFKAVLDLLEHGADPRITCRGLVGPDYIVAKDAAAVADKIEIVDLIRHYRWRKISLVPNPLSYPQESLLKRHGSGVYVMWEWPRAEKSPHVSTMGLGHKRQRIFPDIQPVYRIYENLAFDSQRSRCHERQWQLRPYSYQEQGWSLEDHHWSTFGQERATKWVHFSAQNRRWVEDFCRLMYSHDSLYTEGIDILTFIDDTFDHSGTVGYHGEVYREPSVKVSTLPVVIDKQVTRDIPETHSTIFGFSGGGAVHASRQYTVSTIVVPLIDIDMMRPGFIIGRPSFPPHDDGQLAGVKTANFYEESDLNPRDEAHVDMILSLHSEFKVQRSRSLDHYFHRDLTDADLQIFNAEQVVSRFIHHQQAKRDSLLKNAAFCDNAALSETPGIASALRRFLKVLLKWGMASTSFENTPVEEGLGQPCTSAHLARQHIIVVPQLWLWKIDNVLISAFPARWDSSNLHSASEYVRSRVETQGADVMPDKLLHEIVAACLEYQPTFTLFGRQLTYQDAFSGEISRISREIDQCYKSFRNDLGKSDTRFLDAFKTATTSLLHIDDALNELKMIKRVYQNQAQVWEDMHKDPTLALACGCTREQAPRLPYTMVTRLEEDAHSVREAVVTLLQLTQGSASTENALKASEQSKILAIFTVVTVIFTPLSWVAALFALKIDGFHGDETWSAGQVAGGSIICLGGTLLLCVLGWKWLNRGQVSREQTHTTESTHRMNRS